MTMWPRSSHAVPVGTAQVARAAFPNGCLAIRIRDALGELFEDAQFAGLFAVISLSRLRSHAGSPSGRVAGARASRAEELVP
jgi:hypothetical protein